MYTPQSTGRRIEGRRRDGTGRRQQPPQLTNRRVEAQHRIVDPIHLPQPTDRRVEAPQRTGGSIHLPPSTRGQRFRIKPQIQLNYLRPTDGRVKPNIKLLNRLLVPQPTDRRVEAQHRIAVPIHLPRPTSGMVEIPDSTTDQILLPQPTNRRVEVQDIPENLPRSTAVMVEAIHSTTDTHCHPQHTDRRVVIKNIIGHHQSEPETIVTQHPVGPTHLRNPSCCPITRACSGIGNLRRHVMKKHLPPMFRTERLSMTGHHQNRLTALKWLADQVCGSSSESSLAQLLTTVNYWNEIPRTAFVDTADESWLQNICSMEGWSTPSQYILTPVNSVALLCHWRVLAAIVFHLSEEQRALFDR